MQVILMNLAVPKRSSSIQMTLILETLASGNVAASILEFPSCRVEAGSREVAIEQIRQDAAEVFKRVEVLPINIAGEPIEKEENPWVKFAGMFENDPDWAEIAAEIRAERESDDDSEVDPSVYAM